MRLCSISPSSRCDLITSFRRLSVIVISLNERVSSISASISEAKLGNIEPMVSNNMYNLCSKKITRFNCHSFSTPTLKRILTITEQHLKNFRNQPCNLATLFERKRLIVGSQPPRFLTLCQHINTYTVARQYVILTRFPNISSQSYNK